MKKNTKIIILSVISVILLVATIFCSVTSINAGKSMNSAKADYVELSKQEENNISVANLDAKLESKQAEVESYQTKLTKFFAISILLFLALILSLAIIYLVIIRNKTEIIKE